MHNTARTRLMQITDFMQSELKDLNVYKNLEYKQYLENKNTRRLVDRMIENTTNALIDIAKILISEKDLEMPDSYAGIMEDLGRIFSLREEEIKSLVQISKLRNILAHEYLNVKWEKIINFIKSHQKTVKLVIEKTSNIL